MTASPHFPYDEIFFSFNESIRSGLGFVKRPRPHWDGSNVGRQAPVGQVNALHDGADGGDKQF